MKLNSKHLFCHFFTILMLSFLFIVGANAEEYRYDVPYINQLDYPEWGQSACGPSSIAMTLRYWYPNSLIDVPEVYHAATQGSSGAPLAYYQDANTGAPLPGYYNVGYATTNVWSGTDPDTAKERVPEEFREFHKNNYSGMVKDYAVSYLRNIWDGVVSIKNQTMTNIINEIVLRPVILNVNEGYGGHFVVLRGYDDSDTEELSDDYFYINDPYPPYADGGTGPFDTATTSANNRKISYETLLGWTSGRDMIAFQPNTIHTNAVREYTVIVDNGIANWGDDGILNSNCNGQSHCFQVDDINASNDDGYAWLCYHTKGMDWIYPTEDGHAVQWTPQLANDGYYDIYVKFYGDSTQSTVQYDIHNSSDNIVGTSAVNQNGSGYQSVSLGQYYLTNGAYIKVANMPANCNADAVMFRYVPNSNIDVALIIDSSGSMTWNDPQDLRKEAAKIFVDTAQNNDQIAIVDFDSWSYLRWPLQPLTENRDSIKSAVDLINSSGGTSLSAGLIEGYNQLNSSTQPYKKAAVFLTDGVGSYNNEADLYKNENNENDCWPIYTIGLGYSTNPALLQSIADTTGGKYFALTDPDQLKNVYFEIATQISGGSSLMSESSVMVTGETYIASVAVPTGQQSATFLTTWPGSDVNTTLTSPSGSEITPANSDPNIYYAKGLTYELYRITNPEAGSWAVSLYGADLAPEGETVNISVSSVGPSVPQDTTPPVITISNPIGGKIYFDQMPTSFNFAVEDAETAVTSQSALLNGSPINNNNDNILLTQLGENVLTITATNEANLTSELSIIFYVNHFSWLPPIKYEKGSSTETLTSVIQANSTLPLKFAIFDADSSFIENSTVKVVVEGTTAQFTHGEGDTNIRINQEEGEEPLYIVNIHTNFNKCDYGLEEGNEYWLAVYFDNILAAKAKMKIE